MKIYITYAFGSDKRNCYSIVEGADYAEARKKAYEATNGKYAFSYDEEEFKGQIERFDLHEIELGPQVML